MTTNNPVERFGKLIEEHVARSGCSLSDVATQAGFPSAEVLQMVIDGDARIPIERIVSLAAAIDCDAGHLFVLAFQTWFTQETMSEIERYFITVPDPTIEARWMTVIRDFYKGRVPELTVRMMNKLYAALRLG